MGHEKRLVDKEKVWMNVQGTTYETFESTLELYPNTLLGNKESRMKHFNDTLKLCYFDVKPELFEAVLFFYQSNGILAKPPFARDVEYKKTLEFFGLVESKTKTDNTFLTNNVEKLSLKKRLWDIFEHPHRSKKGLYFAYFSFGVILISVAMFCMETVVQAERPQFYRFRSHWFWGECVYITFFILEYLARLWSAPNRCKFAMTFLGLVDLFAFMPFFLAIIYSYYTKISYFRILRLVQILRIIKLSRYNSGLRILAQAILSCRRQMFSLIALFILTIIFVSTFVYVAEQDPSKNVGFESIPETMWYAVISMTTVGYGDVVPVTLAGKLSGAVGIFLGTVVLFHLFLPIYLMHFSHFYHLEKERKETEREAKHPTKRNSKYFDRHSSFDKSVTYQELDSFRCVDSNQPLRLPIPSLKGSRTSSIIIDHNNLEEEDFRLTVPVKSIDTGCSSMTNQIISTVGNRPSSLL